MTDRFDYSTRPIFVKESQSRIVVITFIVFLIIIIAAIVLYVLLRGSSSKTSVAGNRACYLNTDCTGSQVCNTDIGVCVNCNVDSDCPLATPLCNADGNKCVACLTSSDCGGSRTICDDATHKCVGCQSSADCSGSTPICSTDSFLCVNCLSNNDCDLNAPYCSSATNQCLECLSNANCALPAVCNSGQCCDQSIPTITSLVPKLCSSPGGLGIIVNYSFSQNPGGVVAIFEIADSTGFVISTTNGSAATGSQVLSIVGQQYIFFSGYAYKIRVKLSQPCGFTAYSPAMTIIMPYPAIPTEIAYTPHINTVSAITTGSFNISTSDPNFSDFINLGSMVAYIWLASATASLDPNRATKVPISVTAGGGPGATDPALLKFIWPFPVLSGQSYYVSVSVDGGCFKGVVSNSKIVLIP